MSRKIVAGNWKMNLIADEAFSLFQNLREKQDEIPNDVRVIIAPPMLYLSEFEPSVEGKIAVAAQNCSAMDAGAFTGEVSTKMLKSVGINYCIIGHSERRAYYGETNKIVGQKVEAAIRNGVTPIFCCGEQLVDRESDNHFDVIKNQINEGVFSLSEDEAKEVIVAYEPVWAIGTGKTASSDQAQEMHKFIRGLFQEQFGISIADNLSILYGGSCKPSNAEELFANPDVDGGLIGGAALNAEDFFAIIKANK